MPDLVNIVVSSLGTLQHTTTRDARILKNGLIKMGAHLSKGEVLAFLLGNVGPNFVAKSGLGIFNGVFGSLV